MFVVLLAVALASPEGGRAGAATCDITPPSGYAMWGYAARRDAACLGVIDKLQARALVIESGSRRLALVSLDLGRAPTRESAAAIEKAARVHGVETVFLAASHTHHGPILEFDTWPTAKNSYVRELERKIGALIGSAVADLRPARLAIGSKESALNRNRHTADGPVDRQLLVLRAETQDGKPIALVVGFAAHPTMRSVKDLRFSADWVGVMAATVEKVIGIPCLFMQGAAGDLSPRVPAGRPGPEGFGASVAEEVLAVNKSAKLTSFGPIRSRDESLRFDTRISLQNPLVRAGLILAFTPDLVNFFVREYKDGIRPRLSTVVLSDRIAFVGVSGEFFASHAVNLKRRARIENLFFVGYCNDYHQYFPTIEAAADGGYGTQNYIAPASLGAGERIMDRALIHLYSLRGKLTE